MHEFLHEPDTPAKVIINEALELARTFSTDEVVAFINGILDAIKRDLDQENPESEDATENTEESMASGE